MLKLNKGRELVAQGCHTCDIHACINPKHLHEGTQSWNMKDARDKGRVFSPQVGKYNYHSRAVKDRNVREALEVRDSLIKRMQSC